MHTTPSTTTDDVTSNPGTSLADENTPLQPLPLIGSIGFSGNSEID